MIMEVQIQQCVAVAKEYGAKKVVLFGSALYDQEHARDIDLIVNGVSGWDAIRMGADMEDRTGVPVDIVTGDKNGEFIEMNLGRGKVLYEC